VSRDGGEVIALDLALDDALLRRGYLRDVVRQVQDLRKNSGLDVADRIVLYVSGVDDLADGLTCSRVRSWRPRWSAAKAKAKAVRSNSTTSVTPGVDQEGFAEELSFLSSVVNVRRSWSSSRFARLSSR